MRISYRTDARQHAPHFSSGTCQDTMPEPEGKGQARAKFFGVEGECEGEAAPFVHKRGASPAHHPFIV